MNSNFNYIRILKPARTFPDFRIESTFLSRFLRMNDKCRHQINARIRLGAVLYSMSTAALLQNKSLLMHHNRIRGMRYKHHYPYR